MTNKEPITKSQTEPTLVRFGHWSLGLCWSLVLGHSLPGCSGYTGPRSVVNDDPAVKIPQIRRAVDANDKSVEPQLVKDLDSSDAAVRFYSIGALSRMNSGETFGYDWTIADRHERAASIAKWQARVNPAATTEPVALPATEKRP